MEIFDETKQFPFNQTFIYYISRLAKFELDSFNERHASVNTGKKLWAVILQLLFESITQMHASVWIDLTKKILPPGSIYEILKFQNLKKSGLIWELVKNISFNFEMLFVLIWKP